MGSLQPDTFQHSTIGKFFQDPPQLGNQFEDDLVLKGLLQRLIPSAYYQTIESDLQQFGKRVVDDLLERAYDLERNPPRLEQYDSWGRRVDRLLLSDNWRYMHNVAAEEGLIAIGYERKLKEWSRLYQFAKLYLFSNSSGLYSCPLAMTDGAARILELLPKEMEHPRFKQAYENLTSRDPNKFWTSGQWMTERGGGSDVANGTATSAQKQSDGTYHLRGYKWFTSATDSDMSLTLAREVDESGKVKSGTGGLTMFYLETRLPGPSRPHNGIQIQKLKSKLGTRQLPTAELLLDGAVAHRASPSGRGVASIAQMLTLTRLHNSMSACAGMRRIIALSRDYSFRRKVFGKELAYKPLHAQTLARLELQHTAATLFVFDLIKQLGRLETLPEKETQKENVLLRLLTPVCKLYTAKQAVAVASEGLESFGGQGYIEETMLPRHLRDAQVLPIWEGTTNVLSLDLLRALSKTNGEGLRLIRDQVISRINEVLKKLPEFKIGGEARISIISMISESAGCVEYAAQRLYTEASKILEGITSDEREGGLDVEAAARDLAFSLARVYMGALLIEHAAECQESPLSSAIAAFRWCVEARDPLVCLLAPSSYSASGRLFDRVLAFGEKVGARL
eukprot:TRINITY_DN14216_c0_g1_i1.p1 TRINITY_DN14216_c0_g1~~TRINITY_DN14216_c0_g1_i1.p1  ORF type:complete len:631 (-),score=128.85 TRINITY_DN14216_c0_g1_i1:44-1909(-)